jgi:hypothetical protein
VVGSGRASSGSAACFPHGSSHLPSTKRKRRGSVDLTDFRMKVFVRRSFTKWWCLTNAIGRNRLPSVRKGSAIAGRKVRNVRNGFYVSDVQIPGDRRQGQARF